MIKPFIMQGSKSGCYRDASEKISGWQQSNLPSPTNSLIYAVRHRNSIIRPCSLSDYLLLLTRHLPGDSACSLLVSERDRRGQRQDPVEPTSGCRRTIANCSWSKAFMPYVPMSSTGNRKLGRELVVRQL